MVNEPATLGPYSASSASACPNADCTGDRAKSQHFVAGKQICIFFATAVLAMVVLVLALEGTFTCEWCMSVSRSCKATKHAFQTSHKRSLLFISSTNVLFHAFGWTGLQNIFVTDRHGRCSILLQRPRFRVPCALPHLSQLLDGRTSHALWRRT
jgi:hypothetical protein